VKPTKDKAMIVQQTDGKNKQYAYSAAEHLTTICRMGILIVCFYWLYSHNYLWATVGALFFAFTLVSRLALQKNNLRIITDASISFLCCTHIFLGMNLGFYENYAFYDKLMHAFGSALLTFLVIAAVVQYCKHKNFILPLSLHFFLVLGISISLGTIWEIFEFTVDQSGLFNAQRGLQDTMLDLVANFAGISCVMFIYLKTNAIHNFNFLEPS
jgi:hypothetical protein